MDDGSGVLLPYMTQIRTNMRENADAGVEAVQSLEGFAHDFAQQLNARMNGVDMSLPENQPFRVAVKRLEEEFSSYMEKIPASNPTALQALASQVAQFDQKLDQLPQPFRKKTRRPATFPWPRKASETATA